MSSNSSPSAAVQLCYEHLNGSCVKTPYSPTSRVILYMVYGFGAVLAVFGNLLVMTAILHFKQLHSPTNFLIASLACTDFLVGVTVMPFSMVRSVESCWYFGQSFCALHTCCDVAFCYSSLFHLSFISIDRYIAVTDPLVYPTKFTVSVSGLCISISWILPITYSGAVFYTGANENGLEELSSALNCVGGCQTVINQNWVLVHFLSFFIPTFVMLILYCNIFLVARQQAKKIENTGVESLWKSRTEFFECKGQIMSNSSPTAAVQLCYEHLNGSCVKTPYSPASRVILYMVYGFGAVLAVFGNLLVMTAILHFKQLHSPTNFLIASLACADFLVGVTVMPFSMVRSVESCWYFGRTFCTFHTCFDTAFCYSSLFHLSFISIDRYIAVTDPLVYPTKFTVSVSGICISISWILPITYSGAVFYTGANENGLEELSSALNCVGGCQTVVNQNWYQQLSTDLTVLKGITVTPTKKSAQAREAIKKLVGECSCLKWRMEIITKRFPNTASTAPKLNTVYRMRRGAGE
ncbi:hypothetical protein R6Z07M_009065 [Ovis aries]